MTPIEYVGQYLLVLSVMVSLYIGVDSRLLSKYKYEDLTIGQKWLLSLFLINLFFTPLTLLGPWGSLIFVVIVRHSIFKNNDR